jgi:hypothetical protein
MNVDASTYPEDEAVGSSQILVKITATEEPMRYLSGFLSGVTLVRLF